jgi:hypothetical protein
MPRKSAKKTEIEVVFVPDMKLEQRLFTEVERELIMADIAYLKQKEIESGDWDKWKKSQGLIDRSFSIYRIDDD